MSTPGAWTARDEKMAPWGVSYRWLEHWVGAPQGERRMAGVAPSCSTPGSQVQVLGKEQGLL